MAIEDTLKTIESVWQGDGERTDAHPFPRRVARRDTIDPAETCRAATPFSAEPRIVNRYTLVLPGAFDLNTPSLLYFDLLPGDDLSDLDALARTKTATLGPGEVLGTPAIWDRKDQCWVDLG
ncbi:MAG: hypothetical protein ACPGID_13165 [Rubricella sp.]